MSRFCRTGQGRPAAGTEEGHKHRSYRTPANQHQHHDNKHEEYLGAESCLVVEDALDKITKLLGRDLALAADSNAARVPDYLQIIIIIIIIIIICQSNQYHDHNHDHESSL